VKASLTILRAVTTLRPRTCYLIGTDAKLSAFLKRNLPDRRPGPLHAPGLGTASWHRHEKGVNAVLGFWQACVSIELDDRPTNDVRYEILEPSSVYRKPCVQR
jgi:hypothetical protein